MPHILFVNSNPLDILPVLPFVKHAGAEVSTANSIHQASSLLSAKNNINIVIADFELSDGKSTALFSKKKSDVSLHFFIMSETSDPDFLKTELSSNVQDVIVKPLTIAHLEKILTLIKPKKTSLEKLYHFEKLVGNSRPMKKLYHFIERVSTSCASVFIIGESGTGKELIADAIHHQSPRKDKPFIAINCGAISSELIESALFGHEKGSFTGAIRTHTGYFEQASGGTLFLDEITETSQEFQIKLLRVLETGVVTSVGGKHDINVDVRIIASTNRCPELAVQQGMLRKDLYHRLNVFPIFSPSLNQRKEDIGVLANFFLTALNIKEKRKIKLGEQAIQALEKINYTGNVRELKNIIHRAYILADHQINPEHISSPSENLLQQPSTFIATIDTSLNEMENRFIQFVLKYYNYHMGSAALSLGISEHELAKKINGFGHNVERV